MARTPPYRPDTGVRSSSRVAIPRFSDRADRREDHDGTRRGQAKRDIAIVMLAPNNYRRDKGYYPAQTQGLGALTENRPANLPAEVAFVRRVQQAVDVQWTAMPSRTSSCSWRSARYGER
ncbi:type II secretion system protein GspG [Paraburkholderia nodosa]|uniref:type II secretion system protein GspG n=1 Tax=Paraburkholderia nodosa TaxID=392320 RepID=UPI0038994434